MEIMEGCQSRANEVTIEERTCPNCGEIVEIASTDISVACDNCNTVIYNDTLNCVMWCEHARECMGDETYEKMMQIAAKNAIW